MGCRADSAIIAYRLARLNCPVVATGEEDYVSDGTRVLCKAPWSFDCDCCNGTGCLLGAVLAAFLEFMIPLRIACLFSGFLAYALAYYGLALVKVLLR